MLRVVDGDQRPSSDSGDSRHAHLDSVTCPLVEAGWSAVWVPRSRAASVRGGSPIDGDGPILPAPPLQASLQVGDAVGVPQRRGVPVRRRHPWMAWGARVDLACPGWVVSLCSGRVGRPTLDRCKGAGGDVVWIVSRGAACRRGCGCGPWDRLRRRTPAGDAVVVDPRGASLDGFRHVDDQAPNRRVGGLHHPWRAGDLGCAAAGGADGGDPGG